jgi:translation elongation factor EF-Ts
MARPPRFLHAGRIVSSLASDGHRGYLLGLACERGFLAESEPFLAFAHDLAAQLIPTDPDGLRSGERPFLRQPFGGGTVKQALERASSAFGETLRLTHLERLESTAGRVSAYVHHDHRVGALVAVTAPAPPDELERVLGDLCLHVVAFAPLRLGEDEATPLTAADALLDQPWIHDPSLSVRTAVARELGPAAHIEGFRLARLAFEFV